MASCNYKFSVVPEFFVDYVRAAKQCPGSKLTRQPELGLLEQPYNSDETPSDSRPLWTRFASYVESLNRQSPPGEAYKVLYLVRHGLSVHNIVMEKVGSTSWKSHWSHLNGDGTVTWVDAALVEQGVNQANELSEFLTTASVEDGVPLPLTVYTSPLARCLETTRLVYAPVFASHSRPLAPMIKERLRERLTDHTCDKRSPRSWISSHYPEYVLEPGFTEADELWKADGWESDAEHESRAQTLLEDVFANDEASFVSLVTHSYTISAILAAVSADQFRVGEGAVVALLVKGVKT